jgi:hypothetical protein
MPVVLDPVSLAERAPGMDQDVCPGDLGTREMN